MNTDEKLQKISKDYLFELLEIVPLYGTILGFHQYDHRMPDGSLKSEEQMQHLQKKLFRDLKSIDPEKLSFDGKIDRGALMNTVGVQIFEEEAHGRWRSQPQAGLLIGTALNSLFTRDFAPFGQRIDSIASRMEQIPGYLLNSRQVLTDPVKVWVESGIEETVSLVGLVRLIQKSAQDQQVAQKTVSRLNLAADKAIEGIKNYCKWLEEDVLPKARDKFSLTPEKFDRLLELRELGMNGKQLEEFGWQILEEAREKQKELAGLIAPGKSVEQVREILRERHPDTFEEVLKLTRDAVKRSRSFVIEQDYATIPEGEKLEVIETPGFARSMVPFGAYSPPGRFEKNQVGTYWMTRPMVEKGQSLGIHNMGSILNTSVHEGYPGHHLQLVCGNTNQSWARTMTQSTEFVEGWAHYCEEMVARMGFSTEPEVMFERAHDMVWRAIRIVVDVQLSSGRLSFDGAVDLLQKESGFDRASCIAEVRRYTFTPGYQLSYLLGKKMIMDLSDRMKKKHGKAFDLKRFHNSMLYAGILPMKYMAEVVDHALSGQEAGV